jgi:hypothetical protein
VCNVCVCVTGGLGRHVSSDGANDVSIAGANDVTEGGRETGRDGTVTVTPLPSGPTRQRERKGVRGDGGG